MRVHNTARVMNAGHECLRLIYCRLAPHKKELFFSSQIVNFIKISTTINVFEIKKERKK